MNLYQCQRKAEDSGYDSAKFLAIFPAGPMVCKWLDAYMGLFQIGDQEGFVMVHQIDTMFPDLMCEPIEEETE